MSNLQFASNHFASDHFAPNDSVPGRISAQAAVAAPELPFPVGLPDPAAKRIFPLTQVLPVADRAEGQPRETVSALVLKGAQVNITVLSPAQRLEISATGLKFDIDGTVIMNSVEHLHDGPGARYARGVLQLLGEQFVTDQLLGKPEYEGLSRMEAAKRYLEIKFVNDPGAVPDSSAFFRAIGFDVAIHFLRTQAEYVGLPSERAWEGFWTKEFKKLTGKSDDAVTSGMVSKLNAKFGAGFLPKDLDSAMKTDVQVNRSDYLTHISLVPHVDTLLMSAGEAGLGRSLCTSSPEWLIEPLLKDFHVLHFFSEGQIYSASKKLPSGHYSGEPFKEAARFLGARPVAIGDTVTDAVSAALSGAKDIIIRFEPQPEKSHEAQARAFIDKVMEALRLQREHPNLAGAVNIFVVEDWRRIEFSDSSGKYSWRIVPAEPLPEYRQG